MSKGRGASPQAGGDLEREDSRAILVSKAGGMVCAERRGGGLAGSPIHPSIDDDDVAAGAGGRGRRPGQSVRPTTDEEDRQQVTTG